MELYKQIFYVLLDVNQNDGKQLFATATNLDINQATKIYNELKKEYFNKKEI